MSSLLLYLDVVNFTIRVEHILHVLILEGLLVLVIIWTDSHAIIVNYFLLVLKLNRSCAIEKLRGSICTKVLELCTIDLLWGLSMTRSLLHANAFLESLSGKESKLVYWLLLLTLWISLELVNHLMSILGTGPSEELICTISISSALYLLLLLLLGRRVN